MKGDLGEHIIHVLQEPSKQKHKRYWQLILKNTEGVKWEVGKYSWGNERYSGNLGQSPHSMKGKPNPSEFAQDSDSYNVTESGTESMSSNA